MAKEFLGVTANVGDGAGILVNGEPIYPNYQTAEQTSTNTTEFNNILSNNENTVQKCLDVLDDALTSVKIQNGFIQRYDSSFSVDKTTRTFTIEPVGDDFSFYSGTKKFTKTTPQSIVFPDTDGLHYIYFDTMGDLAITQTFSDSIITDYVFVSSIYWDAANNKDILVSDERHGCEMDSTTHLYLHNSAGTQFGTPLGFKITNIIADGSGSLETHAQIGVSGGTIWDEDLKHVINSLAAPANIPCFYLTGAGVWRSRATTAYPLVYTENGLANWNRLLVNTWSLVQCNSDDYVLSHLFATNDPDQPIICICGQAVYTTIANAREGAKKELNNLVLIGFPSQEFVPIATLIWQTRNQYNNVPKSRIRKTDSGDDYIDWRSNNAAAGGNAVIPTSWGNIIGVLTNQVDLTSALNGKQPIDADLTAIAALADTSGFLKKTNVDTWVLDTSTYLTTTHLKDTAELVYNETNNTLVISSSGAGATRERLKLVNTDTSVSNMCMMSLYSGASTTNYLQLAQFGTEYTTVAEFVGKSAVQSITGNLLLRASTESASVETVIGTSTKMSVNNTHITAKAILTLNESIDGGNTRGIQFWHSGDYAWAMYMGTPGANKSFAGGTACSPFDGGVLHQLRTRVFNAASRGFLWENSSENCLMSLSADTGNLWTKGYLTIVDTRARYGTNLTKMTLAIDSTKWYRILTLPVSYNSWVDLIVKIPSGHSTYKFRLSKATGSNGIGWNVEYDLGGIYNYNTGNISQFRVVDLGANLATHLDIKFNGNATRDIVLSVVSEQASTIGVYATLVDCTDQGTAAAGVAYDLNYFNIDTTTIGTTHLISNSWGGSFSHLSSNGVQASRWKAGTTDSSIRSNSLGMYIGTQSNHPINFYTNSSVNPVATIDTGGNVSLTADLNFGARLDQMINLYTTQYGIGVQTNTTYLRTGGVFSFFLGGVHSDNANNPGSGGVEMMRLASSGIYLDPYLTGSYWFRTYGGARLVQSNPWRWHTYDRCHFYKNL